MLSHPVIIPSCKHLVGQNEPERFLCPVRATRVYLSRTPDGAYPVSEYIILRHPNPLVKTTKGHVATWIKNTIKLAYAAAVDHPDPVNVNAHEVRAVAHSLVAYSGSSLEEVLEGGRWSSEDSFFNHYLREMSRDAAGSSTPFVAGGHILYLQ